MIHIERVYPSQHTLRMPPPVRRRLGMDPSPDDGRFVLVVAIVLGGLFALLYSGCAPDCGPRRPCGQGKRCEAGRCVAGQPETCGADFGGDPPPQRLRALWAAVSR